VPVFTVARDFEGLNDGWAQRRKPGSDRIEQASSMAISQVETTGKQNQIGANLALLRQGLLIAVGYFLCVWVGISFATEHNVSVVWPPSGFALAMVYRFGFRALAPIWLADTVASTVLIGLPLSIAPFMALRAVAEPMVAVFLLRLVAFDQEMRRLRDIASLVLVGAPISTLLNALATVYIACQLGSVPWEDYWRQALLYWAGNAGGVIALAPALLIMSDRKAARETTDHWIEALALALLAFLVLQLPLLLPRIPESPTAAYFVFPMVAWIALRVPRRVAIAVTLSISAVALLTIKVAGEHPLAGQIPIGTPVGIQGFIVCLMLTCLLLAALNLEKTEIEARLRENDEFLRLAILGSNDGVWDWHPREQKLWLSPRWKGQLGYGPDELPDAPATWSGLVHPEDRERVAQRFSDFLEDRTESFELVQRFRHKLGHDVHILTRGIKKMDEEGNVIRVVGVHTDVTELVNVQDELRHQAASLAGLARGLEEQRRAADAASATKSQFLATMSHEIRTPMNGIIGMLSLMLDSPLDRDQRRWTVSALESSETLLTIINDILDLSKLDAGKAEVEILDFDPVALIEGVVALLQVRANGKAIALRTQFGGTLPPRLQSDPTRLRQILFNLVGNAVKFTETGGVVVRASVESVHGDSCQLRVDVVDTGIGIDTDQLSELFEPFQQADNRMSRRFGGTGLGLAIVRRLVDLLDGSISVRSEVGVGSTFTVLIPCQIAAATRELPRRSPDTATLPHPSDLRVLVAEDNAINRELAVQMLARLGLKAHTVVNGREAVAAAAAMPFDIILMDIQMPEMDGLTAVAAIRALPEDAAKVPIVAVTANAMIGDRERYLAAGFDDYLAKPLRLEQLSEIIGRWTEVYPQVGEHPGATHPPAPSGGES
jgi:PAS domain S-box-containing protein